jgi:uncharacterized protein
MRHFLCLLLVVALGFAGAGAVFTQNTLYVARRTAQAAGTPVDIRVPDGAVLRASWFGTDHPNRCVMILHGISDSRASAAGFAPMFAEQGYATLAPDSRAHGESGGDLVTYGLLEKHDVIAWTRWLRARGCAKIYGLGESLGGSVLIQAAAVEPAFSAIVTESAYADLQDAAINRLQHMFPLQPLAWLVAVNGKWYARAVYGLDLDAASPLQAIRRSRTPTLLIHGLDDDQTPPAHSRRLAAANPAHTELWLVPGIGHASSYSADPAAYRQKVLAWFSTH